MLPRLCPNLEGRLTSAAIIYLLTLASELDLDNVSLPVEAYTILQQLVNRLAFDAVPY
jgi:hypothetical protein